jgi:hypothetical protein
VPLNPQQLLFKEAYTNPNSETFGNATKSAIGAGYGPEYAEQILSDGGNWISEILGDVKRLQKAEKVLDAVLDTPTNGDPALINAVTKVAMFTAETLGKAKYSKRSEVDHTTLGNPIAGFNYVVPEKPNDSDNKTNV